MTLPLLRPTRYVRDVDPITVGTAVATLLGTKAVEEFGKQAGAKAWEAVRKLSSLVHSRLSPQAAKALEQGNRTEAAAEIDALATADPELSALLEALVAEASHSPQLATIIATARDNAKQVNIGGNNSGAISF
jgi:hypothetical protein